MCIPLALHAHCLWVIHYLEIKMKKDKQIQIFKGITKNIFILVLVSLFTDLSSQMVFPLQRFSIKILNL